MGEETALAAQIAEAVQVLSNPASTSAARRAANEFILRVPELPAAVGAATQLAGPDAPAPVRFFGFQLVAGAAAAGRLAPQDPRAGPIREALFDMTRRSTLAPAGADLATVPQFVREKYAQALAAVAIYSSEWPSGWASLQPELLEAGKRSQVHASLALSFFRGVGEVLQSDAASRLTSQRRKALQAHIAESCVQIFQALQQFVGVLFPANPSLDRAAVLLTQELAAIVPVTKFLAADVDRLLLQKLPDVSLRFEVLRSFSEWLGKDIARELKEAPDRMKQFLMTVCDLAGSCRTEGFTADEYEVHKTVAMMIRDFVESNKPSFERHPDLQAKAYEAAVKLLRYPSTFIQAEAASIVPHMLRAALSTVQKGGAPPEPQAPPPWLNLDNELLPLLLLCTHKQIPASFDLFPLPADYRQVMALTSELDMEEDLPGLHVILKGRGVEVMMALTPAPAAILKCLEFVHGLLPRVLGTASNSGCFSSFEAALGLAERVIQNVKVSAGPQAAQACRTLLVQVLQARVPGPEFEVRRLEFLTRCGGAFDVLAESSPDPENALVVQVFTHIFGIIEVAGKELRTKALYASIGVCKAAPKAIRPVLEPIVTKAAGLLTSAADNQHVLCEALVAASTAAQNFEQQRNLVRNLFAPLVARWSPLVEAFSAPGRFEAALNGDRTELDSALQLVRCFECCFRASVVPSDPAIAAAGGFSNPQAGDAGVSVKNPAAELASAVFPGLIALLRAFHAAFPSDVTRYVAGAVAGGVAQAAPKEELRPYLLALDVEELRALTSSLDSKANKEEPDAWENAFPPPPGQDPARVLQGRRLLYGLRLQLYKCLGAACGVQDGILVHPELCGMLSTALVESTESVHPYHLELQLRHAWLALFGPSGMSAAGEKLRTSLAVNLLPRVLSAAAGTLNRYWQWLRLPEGHPAAGANGQAALLWAMCTGTVMASRTFVELLSSLVIHGGPAVPAAAQPPPLQQEANDAMGRKQGRKKKGATMAAGDGGDAGDGSGKQGQGFAGIVFTSKELLEAIQGALCIVAQWQDPKAMGHALVGMRAVAVRLMSAGEVHQTLRDFHASALSAPGRCDAVLRFGLQPLISLCLSPPSPPSSDGALQTVIGKPFADFFSPERDKGRVMPSPFAVGIMSALWPIVWGICQIFNHVCSRGGVKPSMQHVAQFPALLETCKLFGTLRRITELDVHQLLTTMLDQGADQKAKRNALRGVVRKAVDPDPEPGETLA